MAELDIQEIFQNMTSTLAFKQDWHNKKKELYDGKHEATTLEIAIPANIEKKLHSKLGWAGTAVDTLCSDLTFDGFLNDTKGFTRILNDFGGYNAINSAIKNSMIGACSFVSIIPNDDGNPIFTTYSGSEATAIWDSREGFVAGLAANSYDRQMGVLSVQDYLLFLKGRILKIKVDGTILASVEVPEDRLMFVPFIYDQDIAVNPFGNSRINAAAEDALDSGLKHMMLIEAGHEVRMAINNIIIAEGTNPQDLAKSEQQVDMSSILTIFNSGNGTLKMEQITGQSTEELQKMLNIIASNFATAVKMDATSFGFQPSNGSFSEGTLEVMGKPYKNLVRNSREVYGESIKQLAIAAMNLSTGQYYDEWNTIKPVFLDQVSSDKFAQVADGLGKLAQIDPSVDFKSYIERNILGKTVREEALNIELPNFETARNNAKNFRLLKPENYEVL